MGESSHCPTVLITVSCAQGLVTGTGLVDIQDGFGFEYDFATHGHHRWMLVTASNNVRTKVDTGILAVAGVFQRLRARINADATLVTATIDDVASANSISTNIPTVQRERLPQ